VAATTTITTGTSIATLINVFVVQPDRQRVLVELLVRATKDVIQHQPGFVAANIHASEDGTRVVNYAQWESPEAFRAMLASPECQSHLRECGELAESFDPHLHKVESVHHA
jgi:antibiotic biosynthesis monooxygenase (ABM) superfamily enzyme